MNYLSNSPTARSRPRRNTSSHGRHRAHLGCPGAANADGYSNPDQARAECEKRGKAGSQAELKKCCEGLILVADTKQQKKLEARCAAPKAATRPSQGSAPASQVLKVS
jgi:hypothetical protein